MPKEKQIHKQLNINRKQKIHIFLTDVDFCVFCRQNVDFLHNITAESDKA